jgi:serine/threonine-protein kinase RsbW
MTEGRSSGRLLAERRLEIGNALPELRRLGLWLQEALGEDLPRDALLSVDLGLQEAVANVMSYAFPDGGPHTIAVTLRRLDDLVEIEVEDDGIPFDPLAAAPPSLPKRLEDVVPGGNGIRLMRRFLDGLSYRRLAGRNRLVLTRRLAAAGPP